MQVATLVKNVWLQAIKSNAESSSKGIGVLGFPGRERESAGSQMRREEAQREAQSCWRAMREFPNKSILWQGLKLETEIQIELYLWLKATDIA